MNTAGARVVNVFCIGSCIFITQIKERDINVLVCRGQALREEAGKVAPSIFFVLWFLSDPSPIIVSPCHYNWLTNLLIWLWLMRMFAQYLLSILGVSLGGIIWRRRTAHWSASLKTKCLDTLHQLAIWVGDVHFSYWCNVLNRAMSTNS